jgi:hypothetical protein
MYFFLRSGWQVQFLLPDLKTPLPKKLTFADPDKIASWFAGVTRWARLRRSGRWSTHLRWGGVEFTCASH